MSPPSVSAPAGRPAALRLAAIALGLEAAGMATLGLIDLVKVVTGAPKSTVFAVLGALVALGTAAVLLLLARAVLRLRGWAYTPALVLQVLALPVGYSLAVQAGLWLYGGPILALAITVLCLLFAPSSRRVLITPR